MSEARTIEVPVAVGHAFKALAHGAADPHQQRTALGFVVRELSGVDAASFQGPDDTALLMAWREGRRFVGHEILRILGTPISAAADRAAPDRPAMRTTTEIVERG